MRGSIHPARLTRSWRAHLLAVVLLLGVVLAAGCTGSPGRPATTAPAGSAPSSVVVSDCLLIPASCYLPYLFRVAYGIQPLLDSGIDGRGQTVTVLSPAPLPSGPAGPPASASCPSTTGSCPPPPAGLPPAATDIRQDLAAFDRMFQLPAARIQIVTTLAGAAAPYQATGQEIQDLEIVHAVAPAATLRVVLLPSSVLDSAAAATAGMLAGLRLAISGTDVASISWSLGEHYFTTAQAAQMHSILVGAAADHVTVIASSGDNGGFSDSETPWEAATPVKEVSLPASDPLVLAVGGTVLTANPSTGAYIGETAWNSIALDVPLAGVSGGGFSHLYARPAYQDGVPGTPAARGVPDVAGDAAPQGGAPIVFAGGGKRWIVQAGGTGAAAALWGGLVALADQDAGHALGLLNPAIYRIARSSSYHTAFHDITTGNSYVTMAYPAGTAGYRAGPGWDPVTGWGSPDAQVLVPLLARLTSRSKTQQDRAARPGPRQAASTNHHGSPNPPAQGRADCTCEHPCWTGHIIPGGPAPGQEPGLDDMDAAARQDAQLSAVPIRQGGNHLPPGRPSPSRSVTRLASRGSNSWPPRHE
jgi:subtilase family serine protease